MAENTLCLSIVLRTLIEIMHFQSKCPLNHLKTRHKHTLNVLLPPGGSLTGNCTEKIKLFNTIMN